MTAYGSDEAIERLEAAWTCEHLACMEMRGERDRARAVAVALEQELAEVRRIARMAYWTHSGEMTHNEAHGVLACWSSDSAGPLVARLSGGEG